MTDIVERLREASRRYGSIAAVSALEAADELERLRAELATLRASTASVQADQRAERDALRADALRYRWLRDCDRVSLYRGNLWLEGISSLDAAIDAAMARQTKDAT